MQIKNIMEVDAVKLVYTADVPKAPSSPNVARDTVLSAVIGVVLSVAVLSVIYLLDDTIRTEEDVEKRLGLNVLGVIPAVPDPADAAGSRSSRSSAVRRQPAAPAKESEN